MDNSRAHSRYSELSLSQSLSQQSYHVIPEPTINHQEQEDTSDDEDEERESSVGDTAQYDDDANVSENVGAFEAFSPKAILPPKPKEPTQKLLKGKVAFPRAGKTTRLQQRDWRRRSGCDF
jgi:hypothetical protein